MSATAGILRSLQADAQRLRELVRNLRTTDFGKAIGSDVEAAARNLDLAVRHGRPWLTK